jgi:shikimate 5-dehydrogenase
LFGSISEFPGLTGSYFYSNFFKYYNYPGSYSAHKSENLAQSLDRLIGLGYSGVSLSMPFKNEIISYLDSSDGYTDLYSTCNTVLISDKLLAGYNTDVYGMFRVLEQIDKSQKILLLGNGNIGKMFYKYLKLEGFQVVVVSRSLGNWVDRHQASDVIINCTSFGTSTDNSPIEDINGASNIFDLTFRGHKLRLLSSGKNYFSGIYFYKEVFLRQFEIYTKILPDPEYFDYIAKSLN